MRNTSYKYLHIHTGGTDTDEGEGNLCDRSKDRGRAEPWKQNAEAGDHKSWSQSQITVLTLSLRKFFLVFSDNTFNFCLSNPKPICKI